MHARRALDGVLLFDKPPQLGANAALQKVRHLFRAAKAGHTGTLDPLATGLLPICFGEATKFTHALLNADKGYHASVRLGQCTTTGDAEGEVVAIRPVIVDEVQVRAVLARFIGEIEQVPPMHSALKHRGRPLYDYIRRGETVARAARKVYIHELVLERFGGEILEFSVLCSKGTYIRTLAEDIGEALGCGAHLTALRRTRIGGFRLEEAYSLQAIEAMEPSLRDGCLLPLDSLVQDLPRIELDATQARRLAMGQRLAWRDAAPDGQRRLYADGRFIGLGKLITGRLSPDRLLATTARGAAGGQCA